MPRADSIPSFISERIVCRATVNSLGAKRVGEVGTFAAVTDALALAGVTTFDMPTTLLRVRQAINDAGNCWTSSMSQNEPE